MWVCITPEMTVYAIRKGPGFDDAGGDSRPRLRRRAGPRRMGRLLRLQEGAASDVPDAPAPTVQGPADRSSRQPSGAGKVKAVLKARSRPAGTARTGPADHHNAVRPRTRRPPKPCRCRRPPDREGGHRPRPAPARLTPTRPWTTRARAGPIAEPPKRPRDARRKSEHRFCGRGRHPPSASLPGRASPGRPHALMRRNRLLANRQFASAQRRRRNFPDSPDSPFHSVTIPLVQIYPVPSNRMPKNSNRWKKPE